MFKPYVVSLVLPYGLKQGEAFYSPQTTLSSRRAEVRLASLPTSGACGSTGTPQGDGAESGTGSMYRGRLHEGLTAKSAAQPKRPCGACIHTLMILLNILPVWIAQYLRIFSQEHLPGLLAALKVAAHPSGHVAIGAYLHLAVLCAGDPCADLQHIRDGCFHIWWLRPAPPHRPANIR